MKWKATPSTLALQMDKRIFSLMCLGALYTQSIVRAQDSSLAAPAVSPPLTSAEARTAAFFPTAHKFRKIYGDVGLSVQAEVGRTFQNLQNLGVWGNGEWIFMDGKPYRSCGSTDINIFNISFGLKGIGHFFNQTLSLFGGIGPDVGLIYIKNTMRCCNKCDVPNIRQHRSRAAPGVIVKTGAEVRFSHYFYFSFFADYLYLPVHFSHNVDVGGVKVGGGFGARF